MVPSIWPVGIVPVANRSPHRLKRHIILERHLSQITRDLSNPPPATAHQTASHHFIRHLLNLRHVVMKNGLLAAIIPFDGYARPILFSDGALIGSIVLPTNTVADVKLSGLFAGHFHH